MVQNFYQPLVPTKWTDSLEEAYKDEMTKYDRHQKALRDRDKQEEKAVIGADKVAKAAGNLAKIAKFSGTIAKKIEKTKQDKFEVDYNQLEETDRAIIKATFKDEVDLTTDSDNVLNTLKATGQLSDSALSFLEKNSAGNSLRLRRVLGYQSVKNSIFDLDERIENDATLQNAYEGAYQNNSIETFYKNDIYKTLNKLGFNNNYIATNYKSEIDRIAATKGGLASLEYKSVKLGQQLDTDIELIKGIDLTNPEIKADNATFALQTLLKNNTQADKLKVAGLLHRLLKKGDIPLSTIHLMEEGKAVDFAGGPTGEFFFDQKTWDYIKSGATEYSNTVIANAQAQGEAQATDYLAKLYQKDSPFTTQESWNQVIQPLKSKVSEKTWRLLERQNHAAQSQLQYNRYKSQYAESERNGTLDQQIEAIKTIPNNQSREELLRPANIIKEWKENPQNKIAYDEGIHEGAVFKARTTNNFNKAESTLSGGDTLIIQDITAFRRQDLAKRILAQYQPDGTFVANPDIAQKNLEAVELYKKVNDFGVKGGSGKFALTGNVEEPTWGNYGKTGVDVKYNHNAPLSANADKNFNVRVKETPNKAERHKKVGGIFSTNQLLSWLETGKLSKDMFYIQKREGEPMSDLLEKGLRSLADSDAHKDIVALKNIKETSETMPTPDRIILNRLLERVKASEGNQKELAANLVSLFKWYGPEILLHSPKITQQFFDAVDTLNVPENVSTQADQDDTENRASKMSSLGSNYKLEEQVQTLRSEGKSDLEIDEILKAELEKRKNLNK